MANIAEFLRKILESRYGRDVRGSIHDAISAINDEAVEAVNNSQVSAEAASLSASAAANSELAANKAKDDVAAVKTEIFDTAIPQIQQIKTETEQIKTATELVKTETLQIKTETEDIRDDTSLIKADTAEIEKKCAKYAEKCENASAGMAGGFIPCGSLTFEELPALADVQLGWTYNISNDFITTEEFLGGADFYYPAGTNVCAILNNDALIWDCLAGEMSGYLMKRDFDSTLADAKPEFEEATELKVSSGITSVKNLFANVAKIIKVLGSTDLSEVGDDITSIIKALDNKIGSTDISGVGDGSVTGAVSVLNSNLSNPVIVKSQVVTTSYGDITYKKFSNGFKSISFSFREINTSTNDKIDIFSAIPDEFKPSVNTNIVCQTYNNYLRIISLNANDRRILVYKTVSMSTDDDGAYVNNYCYQ